MRVVVTGGSGFMGSHLVEALTEAGHDVTVFDRKASKWMPARAKMVVGELSDLAALSSLVEGADAVYHLAGFADLNAARTRPLETVQANIVGTINLLEAMRAKNVTRFLLASTVYVFSREGGFYRCSKQACESYVEEYSQMFGVRYTVLRYGSLYGPRADHTNGVYRLLRTGLQEGRISYSGAPDDIREYIHVEDAARLSVDALEAKFEGQHLLLTGPAPTRASELFMMFQELIGKPVSVEYKEAASGHYAVTPYTYTPRPGRKLVTTHYVDMGQGLLRMVEEIHHDLES
jgi:UDP-glucose 4-epimerase